MTYNDLFLLLENMHNVKHISMDDRVTILWDNEEYFVDLSESLTNGRVVLIPAVLDPDTDG
jgi:hypothetical protein